MISKYKPQNITKSKDGNKALICKRSFLQDVTKSKHINEALRSAINLGVKGSVMPLAASESECCLSGNVNQEQGLSQDFKNACPKHEFQNFCCPDLVTNILYILITTTSNSILCQKGHFAPQVCPRRWSL